MVPLFGDLHTEQQLDLLLERLSTGIGLDLAAREIGSTATRISRFCEREPELKRRVVEAREEGGRHYTERLRAAARIVALRTEPGEVVPRILEVELATHGGPEYSHLRRDRMRHEGHVTHTHGVVVIPVDPEFLDSLPDEILQRRRELLAELAVIDGDNEQRALPAA